MATKTKPAEQPPGPQPNPPLVLEAGGISIELVDGARAVISLGKEKTEPLDQATLHGLAKNLAKAVQSTY